MCGAPPVAPVDLKTAIRYAILSNGGISTAAVSTITGNIGVSPGTSFSITGFGLSMDDSGEFSIASQLAGRAFASDYGGPIPQELDTAISEMVAAYDDAESRPNTDSRKMNVGGGKIGGMTMKPGVYTFTILSDEPEASGRKLSTATEGIEINGDIIFEGGPDDVFIMQTNGPLTVDSDTEVILIGGVNPDNIFWQVAGNVTVGTDAELQGVLLAKSNVLFEAGSTLEGRILAMGDVTVQMAVIGTQDAFCT